MARKLVTREDVFNAANDLVAAGKTPSIINVYTLIQKGSNTTIKNYLDQWREETAFNIETPVELELPDLVAQDADLFIRKLWRIASERAEEMVQAERTALHQREIELDQETQQMIDMANEHQERIELLEGQLAEANQKQAQADEQIHQLEKRLSGAESSRDRADADLAKKSNELAEVAAKLEEKGTALARAEERAEQTDQEIAALRQKMAQTQDALEAEKAHSREVAEKLHEEEVRRESAQDARDRAEAVVVDHQQTITQLQASREADRRDIERLTKETDKQSDRLAAADQEIRELIESRGVVEGQASEKARYIESLERKLAKALERIGQLEASSDLEPQAADEEQGDLFQGDKPDNQ